LTCVIGNIHTQIVQASLERASLDESLQDTLAALMRAAMTGNTAAVVTLLNKGADINGQDHAGRTALMEAAFGGHAETIEALLVRGADVNARDHVGWTALMEASSKSHIEIVRALLTGGAGVNTKSKNGWTALRATPRGNAEMIKLLKRFGAIR
jgi:ankyrin repeat protein